MTALGLKLSESLESAGSFLSLRHGILIGPAFSTDHEAVLYRKVRYHSFQRRTALHPLELLIFQLQAAFSKFLRLDNESQSPYSPGQWQYGHHGLDQGCYPCKLYTALEKTVTSLSP